MAWSRTERPWCAPRLKSSVCVLYSSVLLHGTAEDTALLQHLTALCCALLCCGECQVLQQCLLATHGSGISQYPVPLASLGCTLSLDAAVLGRACREGVPTE